MSRATQGLALDASGAFDVGFGINGATNVFLREQDADHITEPALTCLTAVETSWHARFDKDLIAIVPNRTFLSKVLKHVDEAARKKELQDALTSPGALRVRRSADSPS